MHKKEKINFIKEALATREAALLKKVDNIPPHWDGMELREWIADEFQTLRHMSKPINRKAYQGRLSDYQNDVITFNL